MTDITDYLMKQAEKAEQAAIDLLDLISPELSDTSKAQVYERIAFHHGQASGFRQSTFVVLQYNGTPTHD